MTDIEATVAFLVDMRLAETKHRDVLTRIADDAELSYEGKQVKVAAAEDRFEVKVRTARDGLVGKLRKAIAQGEQQIDAIQRQAAIAPRTVEEWTLANARQRFVKEEATAAADGGNPGAIVGAFKQAVRDAAHEGGNDVEAYLWLREGLKALATADSIRELQRLTAEAQVAEGKRQAALGLEAIQTAVGQQEAAVLALEAVRTPSEQKTLVQRFAL